MIERNSIDSFLEREAGTERADRPREGDEYLREVISLFRFDGLSTPSVSPATAERALWNIQGSLDLAMDDRSSPDSVKVHCIRVLPNLVKVIAAVVGRESSALWSFWDTIATGITSNQSEELLRETEHAQRQQLAFDDIACQLGALNGLHQLGTRRAMEILQEFLSDDAVDPSVKSVAEKALGDLEMSFGADRS